MEKKKRGTSRIKKRRKKIMAVAFFATLVVLYLVIYAFPDVTGALTRTKLIEYGSIQVKDEVTCWFVRSEEVFYANDTGALNYYVEEGEQVRKGTKILDIASGSSAEAGNGFLDLFQRLNSFQNGESLFTGDMNRIDTRLTELRLELGDLTDPEARNRLQEQIGKLEQKKSQIQKTDQKARTELSDQTIAGLVASRTPSDYISQRHGLVSYYIDGYEEELTPNQIKLLSREKIQKLKASAESVYRETTKKYEPLYKLVQNDEWYAVCWIDSEDIAKYHKGNAISLQLPLGPVNGVVFDILEDENDLMVIFQFDRYYPDLAKLRTVDTEVITLDYKGLTIDNRCITTEDGQPGVLVKDVNGDFNFKPIKIITSDGSYSLVECAYYFEDTSDGNQKVETVDVYDEILSNP